MDTFIKSDKVFIFPDRGDKAFFKQLIEYYNIVFDWSKNHEDKKTDLLFKFGNKIFILEHKHMKECGGGQDKQMSEIINFISYKESKNVHYVSFLDGVYFNLLVDGNILSGKQHNQRLGILYYLKNNKQNFFVNTSGFKELLRSLN